MAIDQRARELLAATRAALDTELPLAASDKWPLTQLFLRVRAELLRWESPPPVDEDRAESLAWTIYLALLAEPEPSEPPDLDVLMRLRTAVRSVLADHDHDSREAGGEDPPGWVEPT